MSDDREMVTVLNGPETAMQPAGIDALIAKAVERDLDIDKLERLLAMRERHEAELARRAYFAALAEFQARCPEIVKRKAINDRNGNLLYRYAPLSDVVAQVREPEHDCGFSHRFEYEYPEGAVIVYCVITHIDGHSERNGVRVPATKGVNTNAAQDSGIMITYGERRSFLGALGITTADEDMDARLPQAAEEPISAEQAADLQSLIDEVRPDMARFLAWAKVERVEDLPASKHAQAVALLEQRRKRQPA